MTDIDGTPAFCARVGDPGLAREARDLPQRAARCAHCERLVDTCTQAWVWPDLPPEKAEWLERECGVCVLDPSEPVVTMRFDAAMPCGGEGFEPWG